MRLASRQAHGRGVETLLILRERLVVGIERNGQMADGAAVFLERLKTDLAGWADA